MKSPISTVPCDLTWKLLAHREQCKIEFVAFEKENTLTLDERYEKAEDIFVRDEHFPGMLVRVMNILAKEQGWDDARVWCIMTMPTLLSVFKRVKDLDFVASVFRSCCFSLPVDTHSEIINRIFGSKNRHLFRMSRGEPVLALSVTDVLLSASEGVFVSCGVVYDPERSTLQRPLEDAEMLLKVILKKKTLDEDDAVAVIALNTLQKNDQGRTMLATYLKQHGVVSQEAYANILSKYRMCMHCKKRGFKYPKCSVCQAAYYCSKECQVDDWDEHKTKCKK